MFMGRLSVQVCIYIYIYLYIDIDIEREREAEKWLVDMNWNVNDVHQKVHIKVDVHTVVVQNPRGAT